MLELARLFSEGLILQRDRGVQIWGTAGAGEDICIAIQGKTYTARAENEGNWQTTIGPLTASDNETLTISTDDETIAIEDVAIGDVFLCGGQSNMEFLMRYEKHFDAEKESLVGNIDAEIRFYDVPEVAYDGQDSDFDYSNVGIWRKATADDLDYFTAPGYYFARKLRDELDVPIGLIGINWGGTMSSSWMTEEHAREICPEQVKVFYDKLGDMTYEELVASAPENPANARGYGEWDPFNEFIMPRTPGPEEIGAFMHDMMDSGIDLTDFITMPNLSAYPGALYQHMVKRAAPFSVKGVLWYQGESDDETEGSAEHYDISLKTVITDWRDLWKDEELPFLVVQLPGFRSWLEVVNRNYDLIRDAQQRVTDDDEHVWLCSVSDSGEEFDIHPKDKKVVGERLALLALKYLYGMDIEADAPRLREVVWDGDAVSLYFDNTGRGLVLRGNRIEALEVAGDDGPISYDYEIEGDSIILHMKEINIANIVISFARSEWYTVNLYNSEGIPAIPFLTIAGKQ